ncbi:MAG: sulfotransferase [Acidimicrobiales bacterium]|nr:sulfotransferase [Acidimicrobiales bacterium]
MDAGRSAFWLLSHLPAPARRVVPSEARADLRRRLGHRYPWEEGYDFTPPPSDGLPTGPPDFVGVGAPRCGTVWWFRLLGAHPDVAAAGDRPVGLHYFSHFGLGRFGPEDRTRYHGWFPRPPGVRVGEWTANYAAEPWVAPLLADAAPDAKLLFLVRDPRTRLEAALPDLGPARVANDGVAMAEEMERGCYARQLRRLLEFFAPDRVLVLQLERCLEDPAGQLAATYRFLGLDDAPAARVAAQAPARVPVGPPLDPSASVRVADLYRQDALELATLVPDLDLGRWPSTTEGGVRGPGAGGGR